MEQIDEDADDATGGGDEAGAEDAFNEDCEDETALEETLDEDGMDDGVGGNELVDGL